MADTTISEPAGTVDTPPPPPLDGVRAHVGEWSAVAAGAVFTVSAVCTSTSQPRWIAPVVCLVCGLTAAALARGSYTRFWAGCWTIAAAGWMTWVGFDWRGPWHLVPAVALGLGVTAMLPWGVASVRTDDRAAARALAAQLARAGSSGLARYERVFTAAGFRGVKAVSEHRDGDIRVVTCRLPADGKTTLATVQAGVRVIEARGRWRRDSVRFGEPDDGADSSVFEMIIAQRDVLGEDIPWPDPGGEMWSVNDPHPVGVCENGTAMMVRFREVAAWISGVMGAGKSCLINVLIAVFAQCTDTVIWVIDADKRGRLAAPWILPWVRGDTARPVIDWVADTREEAALMIEAVKAWREARATAYQAGSKIRPTFRRPQLVVICDEMAGLTAIRIRRRRDGGPENFDFASDGVEITRLARSDAIMPVWATQRSTVSFTGASDIKANCKLRFALCATSQADAASAVPDNSYVARLISRLRHPGSMVVTLPGEVSHPVKTYRLDPGDDDDAGSGDTAKIHAIAVRCGDTGRRPEPEPEAQDAMGEAYARRWERSGLYVRLARAAGVDLLLPEDAAAEAAASAPPPSEDQVWAGIRDDPELAHLGEGLDPDSGSQKDRAINAVVAMLADGYAVRMGLAMMEIRAGLARRGFQVTRETVHRWVAEAIDRGLVERRNGRYFKKG